MIKLSREDSWVAYVLFLRNRKQFLRSVYVYVVFWTFYSFERGKKNASDEIIWRTPCSTSADPRLKTSALYTLLHTPLHTSPYTTVLLSTHCIPLHCPPRHHPDIHTHTLTLTLTHTLSH